MMELGAITTVRRVDNVVDQDACRSSTTPTTSVRVATLCVPFGRQLVD